MYGCLRDYTAVRLRLYKYGRVHLGTHGHVCTGVHTRVVCKFSIVGDRLALGTGILLQYLSTVKLIRTELAHRAHMALPRGIS